MFYIASATIFFLILTYLFHKKSLKTSVTVSDFIIY